MNMSRQQRRAAARVNKVEPVTPLPGCEHMSIERATQAADILEAAGLVVQQPTGQKDRAGNDIWRVQLTPKGLALVESAVDFDESR